VSDFLTEKSFRSLLFSHYCTASYDSYDSYADEFQESELSPESDQPSPAPPPDNGDILWEWSREPWFWYSFAGLVVFFVFASVARLYCCWMRHIQQLRYARL